MNQFWNERYSTNDYAYGENANEFVKQELLKLQPGKILFPAEGEGRNAVYAATLGWQVSAFDPSTEGQKKAKQLAAKNKVELDYQIAGYENAEYPEGFFDCIVLVFAHMPSAVRTKHHQKLLRFLKPGGKIILEGFSKEQIDRNTGGPRSLDFLFSKEELDHDFNSLSEKNIVETDTSLDEGPFHQGTASVIRVTGVR